MQDMNNPSPPQKIRILHHMARSGGTIISKCLGCMKNIALLSEINPRGLDYINPLSQAYEWYGLLNDDDIKLIQERGGIGFVAGLALINRRCTEKGNTLLIRDWSHLDFTGWPHLTDPTFRLATADALASRLEVINTTTVRHPIDQWLSFTKSQSWTNSNMPLADYLLGYRNFSEYANKIGFIRYEDFTLQPDAALSLLCNRLDIPYDDAYQARWAENQHITTAPGKRDGGSTITPRPRPYTDPQLIEDFNNNRDYHIAIDLLGYEHPY